MNPRVPMGGLSFGWSGGELVSSGDVGRLARPVGADEQLDLRGGVVAAAVAVSVAAVDGARGAGDPDGFDVEPLGDGAEAVGDSGDCVRVDAGCDDVGGDRAATVEGGGQAGRGG